MGIGVALSLVPVLIWEGLLILLAGALSPFLSTEVITEMSAVGGLLIFAIGLNMQGITKIRVGNLLPAIFVPLAYIPLVNWIMTLVK